MARSQRDSQAMQVMRTPAHGDVRRRAEDEVTEASLCQLEVEVAEDARNFLERLDDRRLELIDRGMIDVFPRLAEEPDGRQLWCSEKRRPVGHANPRAETGHIQL